MYFKREDSPELAPYERRLREIATALAAAPAAHPHVWPFQRVLQTERAAYLLRQHLFSDLHDRTLTRPFLAGSEKKWLAFQMLCAVHEVCAKRPRAPSVWSLHLPPVLVTGVPHV